ncbi:Metallo-dependent phosphatase-like protein [Trichoderma austrokoningii]
MAPGQHRRRMLIIAAAVFFIASALLCVTRLYNMSFIRGSSNNKPLPPLPPRPAHHVEITDADRPMTYGTFRRPNMDGLTLMASLPDELVPTFENKRRLVIVGDIHGMDASLETLLQKVDFDITKDQLVAAGDMINKGPDSPGVVSRLMSLNASAVRGNHEDRILLSLAEANNLSGVSKDLASPHDEDRRGQTEFLATGRKLKPEHVEWLAKLPVILAVEPLNMYVVHAGLVPGIKPELQDPWAVMNMRTLIYPREKLRGKKPKSNRSDDDDDNDNEASSSSDEEEEEGETLESIQQKDAYTDRDTIIPIEGRDGEKWSTAWNHFQKRLKKSHRYTVVYGHDAKRGFREDKYSIGLDSGCVRGGALTAVVVEGKEGAGRGFTHTIVQVHCKEP